MSERRAVIWVWSAMACATMLLVWLYSLQQQEFAADEARCAARGMTLMWIYAGGRPATAGASLCRDSVGRMWALDEGH